MVPCIRLSPPLGLLLYTECTQALRELRHVAILLGLLFTLHLSLSCGLGDLHQPTLTPMLPFIPKRWHIRCKCVTSPRATLSTSTRIICSVPRVPLFHRADMTFLAA